MAVTHADLAPATGGSSSSSKTGVGLMVLCILLGLLCFVLCLLAEATRSQVVVEGDGCRYSGNGKTPLICSGTAFLSLAVAMALQHTHLLLTVTKSDSDPSQLLMTTTDDHHLNTLSWQAAFFFITTWICFSVGEVLLLIGISVESGHLKGWSTPRKHGSCFIAQEGLFSAAGVLGMTTVFLASGLSITALRAQWLLQDQQQQQPSITTTGHDVHHPVTIITSHESTPHHLFHDQPGLMDYLRAFDKII